MGKTIRGKSRVQRALELVEAVGKRWMVVGAYRQIRVRDDREIWRREMAGVSLRLIRAARRLVVAVRSCGGGVLGRRVDELTDRLEVKVSACWVLGELLETEGKGRRVEVSAEDSAALSAVWVCAEVLVAELGRMWAEIESWAESEGD